MRAIFRVMAAAALVAAGPAVAQDTNNTAAAAPAAPADTNVAANATDLNATAPVAANEAAPATDTTATDADTQTSQTTEKSSGGFPWGVLGLVGLLGLIPRRNRG